MTRFNLNEYPIDNNVPPIAWLIAKRVTNPWEASDCFILVTARKGAGKSTFSITLAEEVAKYIARLRRRGESPSDFFNVDHIKTVGKDGTMDVLTSGIMEKENQVLVLDDLSTQYNNREFATTENKGINNILTICRVFKGVIIGNCVNKAHIDKVGRGLVDFHIDIKYKNTRDRITLLTVKMPQETANGKELNKFLTYGGKRVVTWFAKIPENSETLNAYKKMRLDETIEEIKRTKEAVQRKRDKIGEYGEDGTRIDKRKVILTEQQEQEIIDMKIKGYSDKEVSGMFGVNPGKISQVRGKYRIDAHGVKMDG